MELKEIKQRSLWEKFYEDIEEKTFLQAWAWGEFQEMMGEKVWRFKIEEKEIPLAQAQFLTVSAKRGKFLLLPHGPVFKRNDFSLDKKREILKTFFLKLKEIAKKEKCIFIRICPIIERKKKHKNLFLDLGFKEAPFHVHPEATWELSLQKSEEELLSEMRKTTRYLIRRAIKEKDIEVEKSRDLKDIEIFSRLHEEVSKSQNFVPFSKKYLLNEFKAFLENDEVLLFLGKYKKKVVGGAFVIFWSKKAFYHHAALLPQYRKLPISYLIVWNALLEAKKRGCLFFDFWGYVSPKKYPSHPWAGPTFFKMGFGGRAKKYETTKDYPLSLFYIKNWIIEKIRKWKRRL